MKTSSLIKLTLLFCISSLSLHVLAQELYTQTGTDKPWKQLLQEKAIPIGVDSTAGIKGSTVDVNNDVVEVGPYANYPIIQDIRIHTVGNSVINRGDFSKWSRWYQEDGNTQVFRIFKDETNVRNDRPEPAGRIESFSKFSYGKGEGWQEFHARYTIIDIRGCVGPHYCGIFQGKSPLESEQWGVMMKIKDNGDLMVHNRASGLKLAMSGLKYGSTFDLKIRDNGTDWEAYVNGDLKEKGSWPRPNGRSVFRWGLYMGKSIPTQDIMMFVTGAVINPTNVPAPASSKPASSKAGSSLPRSSIPASSKPISSNPISSKPISSKPISSKPISSKPISSKAASSKPVIKLDQCDNTDQCRDLFGSKATDCANSKNDDSVCMCGTKSCDSLTPASVAASSTPASVAASSTPTTLDQCNNTEQCRITFGSRATDCANSGAPNSVCMCGSVRCDAGGPSSTPASVAASSKPASVAPSSAPASEVASSSTPASIAPSSVAASSSSAPGSVTGPRVAITADGNADDRDDICATAMHIGLLYKAGKGASLVHASLNDHVWKSGSTVARQVEHFKSFNGAIALTNGAFPNVQAFDAFDDTQASIDNLAKHMNQSTAQSPLTVIMAGRSHIVGSAIKKVDQAKRQYVTIVTHSDNNNTHGETEHKGEQPIAVPWSQTKASGANVVQIRNQNADTKKPYSEYTALRDSNEQLLKFIWERCNVMKVDTFDPSDSGMTYYYLNNKDQNATPSKLIAALKKAAPGGGGGTSSIPASSKSSSSATSSVGGGGGGGGGVACANSTAPYVEKNGWVVMEAENTNSNFGLWSLENFVSGFKGSSHIQFNGNNVGSGPATSPLVYKFCVNTTANYRIALRAHKNLLGGATPADKSNDAYVRLEGDFGAGPNAGNANGNDAPLDALKKDTKLYGGVENGWGWASNLDLGGEANKRVPIYALKAGQTYTLTMSGRSKNFNVDRILFVNIQKDSITNYQNNSNSVEETRR